MWRQRVGRFVPPPGDEDPSIGAGLRRPLGFGDSGPGPSLSGLVPNGNAEELADAPSVLLNGLLADALA